MELVALPSESGAHPFVVVAAASNGSGATTEGLLDIPTTAHGVVAFPLVVTASSNGTYQLTGTASNPGGPSGNALATLTITGNPEPNPPNLYLPLMFR